MPKVSVILPAYNAEKYIKEAVDSILGQTFKDFELIVINDCSKDSTEQILLSYIDPRLVYVKNEQNLGVAGTLNKGLSLAKGTYIARMDADDISLPERFQKQVTYLDAHPDVAVLGTNVETFDENGPLHIGWSSTDPKQMKVDLFFSCGLAHPSVMMRTDVIRTLGGYDMAFEGLEDYDLWCRVSENYGVTTFPEVLFRYRVHSAQVTKNPSQKYLERLNNLKCRQLERLGVSGENAGAAWYFADKRPETKEEICAVAAFYEELLSANQKKQCYDQMILKNALQGVILSAALALDNGTCKEICRNTFLLNMADVRKERLKRSVKRLLGKN